MGFDPWAGDSRPTATQLAQAEYKAERARSRAEYDQGFLEAIFFIAIVGKDPLKLAATKCNTMTPENEARLREILGDPEVEEL